MKAQAALIALAVALAQTAELPLQRLVTGQVVKSGANPAVTLKFPSAFKYLGGQRFILYDIADAEQHFFVDADSEGRVRRLYWVQFEGYLPAKPTFSYNYKSPKRTTIGGLEFIVDTEARRVPRDAAPPRPGSDSARTRALMSSKGLRLPEEQAWVRLVHLTDAGGTSRLAPFAATAAGARRNELMIIYLEDLSSAGFKAEDFAEGGRARQTWPEFEEGLLKRAAAGLKISKPG